MAGEDTPTPLSRDQLLGIIADAFLSRTGLVRLKVAGPLLTFMEAAAQADARAAGDVFAALVAADPRTASGNAQERIGASRRRPRLQPQPAIAQVTVYDQNVVRKATRVSAARPAPIAGSSTLDVLDASAFPSTGSVYVGRGTAAYEGPLAYTSRTDNGGYWTLALSSPTVRYHAQDEEVVLAQGGNRTVGGGAIVQTRRGSREPQEFVLPYGCTIPDGEREVLSVRAVARRAGTAGNVPSGTIVEFASSPFPGAACVNPLPAAGGRARESNEDYAERLARWEAARVGSTPAALVDGVVDLRVPEEAARVVSASHVPSLTGPSTLVVDDGSAYEPTDVGVAREVLEEEARGGETRFRTLLWPLAPARLVSTTTAPFTNLAGKTLAVDVGGTTTQHTFTEDELGTGSAEHVAAAVNADGTLLWRARTRQGRLVLEARASTLEDLEVVVPANNAVDAQELLDFPAGRALTLDLRRDGIALSKDGAFAQVQGQSQGTWAALSGSQTLTCAADGTSLVTYTVTDDDFRTLGTGYDTVGANTPAAWAAVLSAKIPGLTFTVSRGGLLARSNLGRSARARVRIIAGTLVAAKVLPVADQTGRDADYVLSQPTGQVELLAPLAAGSLLEAGTLDARASVRSQPPGTVELTSTGSVWLAADAARAGVQTGASSATPLALGVSTGGTRRWGTRFRVTSTTGHFSAVQHGNWLTLADSNFHASLRGSRLVSEVAADGSWVELDRAPTAAARTCHQLTVLQDGKVLVTGGFAAYGPSRATASTEVYDPATKTWTPVRPMLTARADHTATLLANGKVLVHGGRQTRTVTTPGTPATVIAAAEVYDPANDTWTATSTTNQAAARYAHTACLRAADGKVYVTGGLDATSTALATSAAYDPSNDTWVARASMGTARSHHVAAFQTDGMVVAGGQAAGSTLATAELYDPTGNAWANAGSLQSARSSARATVLQDGKLLVVGGTTTVEDSPTPSVHVDLRTAGVGWAAAASLARARSAHGQALLSGGKVLVAHGHASGTPITEVYDPAGNTWTSKAAPDQAGPLRHHQLVPLAGDTALAQGGENGAWPYAPAELYDLGGDAWTRPDPAQSAALTMAHSGLHVDRLRRNARPIRVDLASGTGRTATWFAQQIQVATRALLSGTYRTTRVQLRTPTWAQVELPNDPRGEVAVLAADPQGAKSGLSRDQVAHNQPGQVAAVQAGNPALGTPEPPLLRTVARLPQGRVLAWRDSVAAETPDPDRTLVGCAQDRDSQTLRRSAPDLGLQARPLACTYQTTPATLQVDLAAQDVGAACPGDRVAARSPWHLRPGDTLEVLADSRRITAPLYRRCRPTGSYGDSVTLRDDATGTPRALSLAFGTTWAWTHYAVHLRPRGLQDAADVSKRLLWRWWRHGSEQDLAVALELPDAPLDPVRVAVDDTTETTARVKVYLAGGARKTGETLRPSTRVGWAVTSATNQLGSAVLVVNLPVASASRTANVTTCTLTLPAGVTDHGLQVGWLIHVRSDSADFATGIKVLTARAATTISYAEVAADVGATANVGVVSADVAEATLANANPSWQAGDLLRVNSGTDLPAGLVQKTLRATSAAAGSVLGKVPWTGATSTTLAWAALKDSTAWVGFQNPAQTATTVSAAVNALYAAGSSPVSATVTGTGAGTLDRSTHEAAGAWPSGTALVDGLNWVKSHNAPIAGAEYTFAFKRPVSASLLSDSDWTNEEIYLVPTGPEAVADWLASEATSGLPQVCAAQPVAALQSLALSSRTPGSAGSVEVLGGSASAWSAPAVGQAVPVAPGLVTPGLVLTVRGDAAGLAAGQWAWCRNASSPPKTTFASGTVLSSWTGAGRMTFDAGGTPVWTPVATSKANCVLLVERQGPLTLYLDTAQGSNAWDLSSLGEGDWLVVRAPAVSANLADQVAEGNRGQHRVVRVVRELDGRWGVLVETTSTHTDQTCEADCVFPALNSAMPGDTIRISTDVWGAGNQADWVVTQVGGSTPWDSQFVLDVRLDRAVAPVLSPKPALGAAAAMVTCRDAVPASFLRKVWSVVRDGSDSRVRLKGGVAWSWLGAQTGTVLHAADKLAFPAGPKAGQDGYRYSTGLVGAAARVVHGDPADPETYPGLTGVPVLVEAPLVRRVRFGVAVRVRATHPRAEVAQAVRSAVAGAVNGRRGVGPVPISELLAAAQGVPGVVSAVPSGTFGVGADLLPVPPGARGRVLDESDVTVTYLED